MNAIGPVEPGDGTTAPPPRTEGPAAPAAPPGRVRRRRTALALGAALALAAAAGYGYATRPRPAPEPPAPWPAQVTSLAYLGPSGPTPGTPGASGRAFDFRFGVTVTAGPPVTVVRVTQPYQGIDTVAEPQPPFTVAEGTTTPLTVHMFAHNCAELPPDAAFPFLDVTLRNKRAMQTWSFIFGGRYPSDLSSAIRTACPAQTPTPHRPRTGTAGSHHAKHAPLPGQA